MFETDFIMSIEERAKYGAKIVSRLSAELTNDFGKGYSTTNIKYFRQFYLAFPIDDIWHILSNDFDIYLSYTPISHTVCDQSDNLFLLEVFPKHTFQQYNQ